MRHRLELLLLGKVVLFGGVLWGPTFFRVSSVNGGFSTMTVASLSVPFGTILCKRDISFASRPQNQL